MDYHPRDLTASIRRALKTFPATLVTGPRQCGKTTLLREAFGSTHRYLSLDRPDVRARATADPVGFFADNPAPLLLDEIQYAPTLLHYIKERIELDRSPGRWLLTGSQSFPLMQGIGESLAGRVAVLRLDPLSTREATRRPPPTLDVLLERTFGGSTGALPGFEMTPIDSGEWMLRGGYPEPRLNPDVDRVIWFSSYIQTYLQRDVRDILRVGDLDAFSRFVFLVAARTGGILNLSDLGRDVGVSAPTVRQWMSVLEASQIIYLLRPWHRNIGKRVRKAPKVYLIDPGLASFLMGLHSRESIQQGPSHGSLLETAVIGEWIKAFRSAGLEPPLSYWQVDRSGEIDLIIEYDDRLYALEVKATATPTPEHARTLVRWGARIGGLAGAAVACNILQPVNLAPGVRAIPWHLAW